MWQQNLVSLAGCGALLLIWLVSALYLAPSMQSHVQTHGDQLLESMDFAKTTNADGLSYHVRGVSADRKARIRVYKQLAGLHPIVSVHVEMQLIDPVLVQEPIGLDKDHPLTIPSLDEVAIRCEGLRELDPSVHCS